MVIASYTQTGTNYHVVLDTRGEAVACNCKAAQYGRHCRHREVATSIAQEEIARAARFQALKERYDYRSEGNRRARYVAMYDPCLVA